MVADYTFLLGLQIPDLEEPAKLEQHAGHTA
jgi:hypothetical protein